MPLPLKQVIWKDKTRSKNAGRKTFPKFFNPFVKLLKIYLLEELGIFVSI